MEGGVVGVGGGRSRRYEFGGETNAQPGGLTLGGILSIKQTPPYRIQDRTLLDLIRDDQTCGKESKKTWKMFREKLRLKLSGFVCTTTLPTLASHVVITTTDSNRVTTRHGSTQQNSTDESRRLNSPPVHNTSSDRIIETQTFSVQNEPPVEEIEQTTTEEERGGGREGEPAAARMSLMSLLEVDGSAYLDDDEEEVEEEEEAAVVEEGRGGGGGGYKYNNCCVCMVRHKGAAFIPCGHTFCRLCSRELFVQRASCPLCNHFISEILDIF
ncbi:uncharacterized protein LOC112518553 [Cynara cardunculus var. scolymus]|uniref:Zinc finger, RING/FYVE/PHD-type n=1 Tax=Cynara cardunculus var. scolymus TaxID=59895 RepID=A0A103XP30_CYNCS|nr:uncharacterized protein LOC112518553 [Cynara cardunculus var. scolymus]KVH94230.1 Zinc finger, RING/FYVE/PHD-type [Cynara cardunculus var. scolymus]